MNEQKGLSIRHKCSASFQPQTVISMKLFLYYLISPYPFLAHHTIYRKISRTMMCQLLCHESALSLTWRTESYGGWGEARIIVTTVKNIRSIPVCQKLLYNTIHVPSGMGSRQFGRQLSVVGMLRLIFCILDLSMYKLQSYSDQEPISSASQAQAATTNTTGERAPRAWVDRQTGNDKGFLFVNLIQVRYFLCTIYLLSELYPSS